MAGRGRPARVWLWALLLLALSFAPLIAAPPAARAQGALAPVCGSAPAGAANPALLTTWGGWAFFQTITSDLHAGLWRSDGTCAGTSLLAEIAPSVGETVSISSPFLFRGALYFLVDETTPEGRHTLFWRTDGTPANTALAFDAGAAVGGVAVAGDTLFFIAGSSDYLLFRSDGTAAGTAQVPLDTTSLGGVTATDSLVFFNSFPDRDGSESPYRIWRSDGTAAGSFPILEGQQAERFAAVGARMFFSVRHSAAIQLWVSDGSPAGTRLVREFADAGPGSEASLTLYGFGGRLFIGLSQYSSEQGSLVGGGLWVSDGTAAGTTLVAGDLLVQRFSALGGALYFTTPDEIWISDGTPGGTRRLAAAAGLAAESPLALLDGALYFLVRAGEGDPGPYYALWRTDSSPSGARQVSPAGLQLPRQPLLALEDVLLFSAGEGGGARELWRLTAGGAPAERVSAGLLALYDFNEGGGSEVHDRSGAGGPLDLKIRRPRAAEWVEGGLRVAGSPVSSAGPAKKLIRAAKAGDAFTVEAWVTPADAQQYAARIVTISPNEQIRNLTLSQGVFDRRDPTLASLRLRTTATSNSGRALNSPSGALQPALTHLAVTFGAGGRARLYLNGELAGEATIGGELDSWNGGYPLVLAGERSGARSWRGTYHLVAFYGRELSAEELRQNYLAGPEPAP